MKVLKCGGQLLCNRARANSSLHHFGSAPFLATLACPQPFKMATLACVSQMYAGVWFSKYVRRVLWFDYTALSCSKL